MKAGETGYGVDGDADRIVTLVRQAVELGADVVKADPTDDLDDYGRVVEAAGGRPVLVRGGGRAPDEEILRRTEAVLAQGSCRDRLREKRDPARDSGRNDPGAHVHPPRGCLRGGSARPAPWLSAPSASGWWAAGSWVASSRAPRHGGFTSTISASGRNWSPSATRTRRCSPGTSGCVRRRDSSPTGTSSSPTSRSKPSIAPSRTTCTKSCTRRLSAPGSTYSARSRSGSTCRRTRRSTARSPPGRTCSRGARRSSPSIQAARRSRASSGSAGSVA